MYVAGWWPWFSFWQPISGMLAIVLAFIGIWLIGRYYDQTFGKVKQPSSLKSLMTGVFFIVLFYASNWAEYTWQWPVSASMLVFALMYGYAFWFTGRIVYQYLAAACLLVIVSLLPLTGLLTAPQLYLFGPESAPGITILGLVVIIVGLIDHWWLTRSLQSLREGV